MIFNLEKINKLNWRSKLLILFVSFSTLPVLGLSFWTYQTFERSFKDQTLESLKGIAKAKGQAIEQFSANRLRNVEQISLRNEIVSDLKQLMPLVDQEQAKILLSKKKEVELPLEKEGGNLAKTVEEKKAQDQVQAEKKTTKQFKKQEKRKEAISNQKGKEFLIRESVRKALNLILRDQKEYEELLVISPYGDVLVSTFIANEGKTAKNIDYFEKGLKLTFIQPVFVSSITEKLTMVVATPIKDEAGKILGVLAARLNLDMFFKMITETEGLGKSGETIVAKKIEQDIIFMAPTRHNFKAALNEKIKIGSPKSRFLQEAARGQSGSGENVDYRSIRVLVATEYLPTLDWGLSVKIDQDEALKPVSEVQTRTLFVTLAIVVIAIFLSMFMSQTMVRPLQELKDATDRISKGDMNVKLMIRSGDEVGELADSFGRMVAALKFFKDSIEKPPETPKTTIQP